MELAVLTTRLDSEFNVVGNAKDLVEFAIVSRLLRESHFQRNIWRPIVVLIHICDPRYQMEQQAMPS